LNNHNDNLLVLTQTCMPTIARDTEQLTILIYRF